MKNIILLLCLLGLALSLRLNHEEGQGADASSGALDKAKAVFESVKDKIGGDGGASPLDAIKDKVGGVVAGIKDHLPDSLPPKPAFP